MHALAFAESIQLFPDGTIFIHIALILGMIWLAARVYRIGILMYGKKPTIQEIWRWVRYA